MDYKIGSYRSLVLSVFNDIDRWFHLIVAAMHVYCDRILFYIFVVIGSNFVFDLFGNTQTGIWARASEAEHVKRRHGPNIALICNAFDSKFIKKPFLDLLSTNRQNYDGFHDKIIMSCYISFVFFFNQNHVGIKLIVKLQMCKLYSDFIITKLSSHSISQFHIINVHHCIKNESS